MLKFVTKAGKRKNIWFNEECRKAIENRTEARIKALSIQRKSIKDAADYRLVKKIIYFEIKLQDVVTTTKENNLKNFYQVIRKTKLARRDNMQ